MLNQTRHFFSTPPRTTFDYISISVDTCTDSTKFFLEFSGTNNIRSPAFVRIKCGDISDP